MQSQTPISSNEVQNCMVTCGRWAYAQGVGSEAQVAYQRFYETYLAAESGMVTTAQPAARQRQSRARPRTQTAAGTRTRAAGQTRTRAAGQTRTRPPRVRTASGTPGPSVARVLAKIVSTPEINIEGLRRSLRSMEPNIVGTALGRLFKAGHITGTPKVGPFTATAAGIEANNRQPTSINTRRRTTGRTTQVTEPAGQMQQTG
jgi:hypothetical protein